MSVPTTEYTSHTTSIPGLLFFNVTDVSDERGYFQEKFQKEKLIKSGLPESFTIVQNSLSYNKDAGVNRGIHAEPWDKYITVITGKVFAAYVDLREGDTFGKVVTTIIDKNTAVYLPEGVGNSFQTLEPDTNYLYSVNSHWSADNYDKYCFVNLADKDLGIEWPIALDQSIMSERDRNHPLLGNVLPRKV